MMAAARSGQEPTMDIRWNIRMHLAAVLAAVAAIATAIFVTHSRLPATDFYHVSHQGVAGGASRALVYSNFPVSLVGLALIGVSLILLGARSNRGPLNLV